MPDLTRGRLVRASTLSPKQAAPFSWFTGPHFALVLGAALLLQSASAILALWDGWSHPYAQLLALAFLLAATLMTSRSSRTDGREFTLARGALILSVAAVGFAISAIGAAGGTVQVEHWWAATAIGVVFGGLTPVASARQLIVLAIPSVVFVGAATQLGFVPSDRWNPPGVVAIGMTPLLIGVIASVGFVLSFVALTRRALERLDTPNRQVDDTAIAPPPRARDDERMAAASADAIGFLTRIAESGAVDEADRAEAVAIARQLRSTLVIAAHGSWLDIVADQSGLTVVDPARLADRMDTSQRVALSGLLAAVVDNPGVDERSLLIELRARDDGSTAVAVRLDVDLPEGRRVMMLAPYYLTLKMAVTDLSWAGGREVLFRFQIEKPPPTQT
ncbi:MAG: hypothetical protein ABWY54_03025 [Glaciihabitans sp.]